jgi:hypothetical protein
MQQFDPKAPTDIDWFRFDWSQFLVACQSPENAPPDRISGVPTIVVSGQKTDIVIADVTLVGAYVYFQGSGGTAGYSYSIVCTIMTVYGRTESRTAYLPVAVL